jgi:hypothetical protein
LRGDEVPDERGKSRAGAVHRLAVTDLHHEDDEVSVFHRVNDSVVSGADTIEFIRSMEFLASGRTRGFRQGFGFRDDPALLSLW